MRKLFFILMIIGFLYSTENVRGLLKNSNISLNDIYNNKWAVIIGINDYENLNPLQYAVEDAKSIKTLLTTQYGFLDQNIIYLIDENASKINIENAFYTLVEKSKPNDAVIFFFAGHGTTKKQTGGDGDLGYLIPIDGDPEYLTRSAISMSAIKIFSDQIPAKSILFLIDACYGGLAAVGQYRSDTNFDFIKNLTADPSRQIITAGKANEMVVENSKWGHSAFTKVLIDGLMLSKADNDQDGIIMVTQLYSYIMEKVGRLTDGRQTPQFDRLSNSDGEFVFIDEHTISDKLNLDFSGFSYLSIPSKPFGAEIIIDDRNINKKTPIVEEKIDVGYHTISIVKEGYSTFEDRILFAPNETITIQTGLKQLGGILNFSHLPKESELKINEDSINLNSTENITLNHGKHAIELTIPGYEDIPLFYYNIDSSIVYPLIIPKLTKKTTSRALTRSAIFPGWGQLYFNQPRKAISFGSLFMLTGGYCLYNLIEHDRLNAEYNQATYNYENSYGNEVIFNAKWESVQTSYDQLTANQQQSSTAFYLLGGVYILNMLDLMISNNGYPSFNPLQNSQSNGIEFKFNNGKAQIYYGIKF